MRMWLGKLPFVIGSTALTKFDCGLYTYPVAFASIGGSDNDFNTDVSPLRILASKLEMDLARRTFVG